MHNLVAAQTIVTPRVPGCNWNPYDSPCEHLSTVKGHVFQSISIVASPQQSNEDSTVCCRSLKEMQEFSEMVLRLNGRETTDSFDLVFAKSDGKPWTAMVAQSMALSAI